MSESRSASLRAILLVALLQALAVQAACAPASTGPADPPALDPDASRPSIILAPPSASPPDDAGPWDAGEGAPPTGSRDGSGDAACEAGLAPCGGECVDLARDVQNCGACGHVCAPGSCSGGACQPWQVNSSASGAFASHAPFACDGTALVWPAVFSNGASARQVAADGSPSNAIALGQPATDAIIDVVIAASFVFWSSTDGSTTTLWQASEGVSGSAASVATFAGKPQGLAVDARAAYAYLDTVVGNTVLLRRCNVAGTTATCTILASYTSSQPGPLVVDDSAVYWTDPGSGDVSQYVFASGAASTLAPGQRNPGAIALDANDVYWIADGAGGAGFAVNAVSKHSGNAVRVVAAGSSPATALATDGTNVYVGVSGVVQSVPIGGGAPTTIATAAAEPIDFACVGGALYWAVAGSLGVYGIRVP